MNELCNDVIFRIFNLLSITDLDNLSKIYFNIKVLLNNYWKYRLFHKFGLKTLNNLDHEFVCRFLDDGRNTVYDEALRSGYHDIVKLLLDNKVVEHYEPCELFNMIHLINIDLAAHKHLLYNEFINTIINSLSTNIIGYNGAEWDQIIYTKDLIVIKIERGEIYLYNDDPKIYFTKGKLLYQIMLNLDETNSFYCKKIQLTKIGDLYKLIIEKEYHSVANIRSFLSNYYEDQKLPNSKQINPKQINF